MEYRVGELGATVYDAEGRPVAYLRPGCTVVPGERGGIGTSGTETARPADRPLGPTYADKVIRPERR